jgi:dCTP deaminase
MILTGTEIEMAVSRGDIVISPFNVSQLSPNSYDFRLGNRCRTYELELLDASDDNKTTLEIISPDGILLEPNRVYLFNTEETMGSRKYVPIIRGRSSIGRLGLFIDITADLIDLGSINQWTLQLCATHRVKVFPGMLIGQVTFWRTFGRRNLYKGKYGNEESPVASLSYLDFENQTDNER